MSTRDHRDEIAFHVDEEDSECEVSEAALEQPFALGAALRADVDRELAARDGEWSAFEAHVLRTIGDDRVAEGRMSLEDRAISAFKAQVDGEIADLAPDFSKRFRDGVEARIWQAAKEQPSLGERLRLFFGGLLDPGASAAHSGAQRRGVGSAGFTPAGYPWRRGFALAGAAAALVLAVAVTGTFELGSGDDDLASADGPRVVVDEVSFEGSATVMSEGAVTVVWLTDPTS